jgi:hypothetical protein
MSDDGDEEFDSPVDDVDADGTNYDPDEADNEDSQEKQLENAREARAWALE